MFLKILLNSQEKTCAGASFSIRLQAWPVTFTKETLAQKFFCEFCETFKNNYYVEDLQMADYGFWTLSTRSNNTHTLSTRCNNTYTFNTLQQHIHFPHVATTHTLATHCNNTYTFQTLQQHIHFRHVATTHTETKSKT